MTIPVTRPSLLIRIRCGDSTAWEEFVELYAPLLYQFFRNRGLQDADAADLTQDVLQGVSVGSGKFEHGRSRFRSWLFGIARHKLSDFLSQRNRGHRVGGTDDLLSLVPDSTEDQDQWEQEYQNRLFYWAAEWVRQRVDSTTWTAFWETAVQNRAPADVAGELGFSLGAVYVAKSRVIARIRNKIAEVEEYET